MLEPEDHDGAERDEHAAQIGTGKRLAVGQRGIDAGIHPGAFADDFGEEPELADGAPAFAGEAVEREAGFEMGALEQVVADGEDFLGDALEKSGAGFGAEAAVKWGNASSAAASA